MDSHSLEARLFRRLPSELTAHVGGKPFVAQRTLIERIANLALHVETLNREALEGGMMSEHDSPTYLARSNKPTLTLRELSLSKPQGAPGNPLQQRLARKAAWFHSLP